MTTQINPENGENKPKSTRGILCAECEHLNPAGKIICNQCGGELYVTCEGCGSKTERVYSRCSQCRAHLHPTWWDRLVRKWFGRGKTNN
jgi:predicted amidophosphoribosyltransferase